VALNIFGNIGDMGVKPGDNTSETMGNFTKNPSFSGGMTMGMIWGIVLTASGAVGLVLAWLTQDASILGVFIFSGVFWSSFINAMVVINAMGFIPLLFIGLFTLPIIFIFVGAVIGMLSGV